MIKGGGRRSEIPRFLSRSVSKIPYGGNV